MPLARKTQSRQVSHVVLAWDSGNMLHTCMSKRTLTESEPRQGLRDWPFKVRIYSVFYKMFNALFVSLYAFLNFLGQHVHAVPLAVCGHV